MSAHEPAYRVEKSIYGHSECGRWLVIQPDGEALDCAFDNIGEANETADELNRAYELGRKSAAKKTS